MHQDRHYKQVKECLQQEREGKLVMNYSLIEDGFFKCKGRWYMPCMGDLKKLIFDEFHKIPYSDHRGYKKMITNMKKIYYWPCMKKDVGEYISRRMEC